MSLTIILLNESYEIVELLIFVLMIIDEMKLLDEKINIPSRGVIIVSFLVRISLKE